MFLYNFASLQDTFFCTRSLSAGTDTVQSYSVKERDTKRDRPRQRERERQRGWARERMIDEESGNRREIHFEFEGVQQCGSDFCCYS